MESVLFIQYGDFRDAYRRFADGKAETYRDQKKSVDFVSALAPKRKVTTLMLGEEEYCSELAPNLWVSGVRINSLDQGAIAAAFDRAAPTHVVLRTPNLKFLAEARRRDVWILPIFADIFARQGPRRAWYNLRMRRAVSRARAPCICNHSLNASRSLVSVLGIPAARVVPWDWSKVPLAGPAKSGVMNPACPSVFFAGAITRDKGVGDCLQAVAELHKGGFDCTLTFAGPGDLRPWRALALELGITDSVRFLGTIQNSQVREQMRRHDFVIVSSRHSYAEGFPNTIYEALASRSVLIMSDHPAFVGRLAKDLECLVFPAENPAALAQCVKLATADGGLYRTISENAERAHERLYFGMEWPNLVETFLADPENRTGWVESHSLLAVGP